jgi:hypothetical protein
MVRSVYGLSATGDIPVWVSVSMSMSMSMSVRHCNSCIADFAITVLRLTHAYRRPTIDLLSNLPARVRRPMSARVTLPATPHRITFVLLSGWVMTGSQRAARSVYVYSDETGQQSRGAWLVVAAVVITEHRKEIERQLEGIEYRTDKRHLDWYRCDARRVRRYLEEALAIDGLNRTVHFRAYEHIEPADYHGYGIATVLDVANLLQPLSAATFVPEGFTRPTRERLERAARGRFKRAKVWSSGFHGCSIVRFADAVAGLIGEHRFRAGSKRHFPELVSPYFVELKNETPRLRMMSAPGGRA